VSTWSSASRAPHSGRKAATFSLAEDIGGKEFLDLVIEETHSCYLGDRAHRHAWGYGCGDCPACKLRAEGFARFTASRGK